MGESGERLGCGGNWGLAELGGWGVPSPWSPPAAAAHKRQGAQVAPNLVMRRRPAAARATSSADFPFPERSPQGMRGVVLPFEMAPIPLRGPAMLGPCRGAEGTAEGPQAHPRACV